MCSLPIQNPPRDPFAIVQNKDPPPQATGRLFRGRTFCCLGNRSCSPPFPRPNAPPPSAAKGINHTSQMKVSDTRKMSSLAPKDFNLEDK